MSSTPESRSAHRRLLTLAVVLRCSSSGGISEVPWSEMGTPWFIVAGLVSAHQALS